MSLLRHVRLRVPAGAARPGPAIGQSLGPLGINMAEFCKQFNEKTEDVYVKETPMRVHLSAFSDRTFTFKVRSPPTSYLVMKAAGVEDGPQEPSPEDVYATITPEAVYEIAKVKQKDDLMWHLPLEKIAKSVVGTARSIGIMVEEASDDAEDEGEEADEEPNPY